MKKFFTTTFVLAAMLGGVATANAATANEITLGQQFAVTGSALWYYTPATDGTLTFISDNGNSAFLYTASQVNVSSEDVTGSSITPSKENYENAPQFEFSFDVSGGTTYYALTFFGTLNMTASFTADAGDTETPLFDSLNVQTWDGSNTTYSNFGWATSNNISGPTQCIVFNFTQDGTLELTQTGSDANNTHLYDKEWNLKSNFSTYNNLKMTDDGYYDKVSSTQFKLTYTVYEGDTFYFYAKSESADNLSQVAVNFTGKGVTETPTAVIGTPFNCYNQLYQFTPQVSGIMSVLLSSFNNTLVNFNQILFTDKAHTANVEKISGEDYAGGGYLANFYVEEGQTYYFWQDENSSLTYTITEVLEKAQTLTILLTQLYPQPGDASWNENISNYGSGFQYLFSPADVQIESATVSYVDADDKPQSVTYYSNNESQMEYMGNGWIVRLYNSLVAFSNNGKPNTYLTVTLNNITYNGKKLDIEVDEVTDAIQYVGINNENGSVSFQYFKPAQPMTLVADQTVWPETIYSSWTKGDENGKAILVFTNPIKDAGIEATVTLGSKTWGATGGGDDPDPSENIPFEINSNIMTLDFTSLEFYPTKTYSQCTIFITGINDIYGQGIGIPSVDKKLPFSNTEAENPVVSMENGNIIKPEGNNYALAMDAFVIQWADTPLTQVAGATMEATLYIDNVEQGKVPVEITKGEITNVNDCLSIDLSEYEGEYGTYLVSIPAGLVQNAQGEVNPAQMVSCYIFEAINDYTVSPEPGAYKQSDFDGNLMVTFPGHALAINPNAGALLWANNRIGGSVAYDSLIVELSELIDGEFSLVVPATYLIIDDQYLNEEITVTYTITDSVGVESLRGEDGTLDIYNLRGVKVSEKNLAKGIYIINGKKVLVK